MFLRPTSGVAAVAFAAAFTFAVLAGSGAASAAGECEMCKFISRFILERQASGETEQSIANGATTQCNMIGGSMSNVCLDMVREYFPYMLYYSGENYPPETTCFYVGMCSRY